MSKRDGESLKNLENDIIYFLNMCSDNDKVIYAAEPKEKKIEDFGRFICLGLAFNMRGVYLSTFAQYERIGDINDILIFLDTVTYEQLKVWVEEFLKNTGNAILKKCAKSIWDEKKSYFVNHKFELSALLQ